MMANGALPKLLGLAIVLAGFAGCEGRGTTSELPLLARYDFQDGGAEGWQPRDAENWRVVGEDGSMVYQLVAPGEPGEIRAPTSWSVLADLPVSSFVFTGRLKSHADSDNPNRDMCLFFHYQDPTHFYYVHFSASSDEVHNIIGMVNGADRIKVNREPAGESVFRLTDTGWHEFKLTFDAGTGEVQVFLDDTETPILTASELAFRDGIVGIGSFDDTGSFDDLKLWGETVSR
jgi:hypothetical protein